MPQSQDGIKHNVGLQYIMDNPKMPNNIYVVWNRQAPSKHQLANGYPSKHETVTSFAKVAMEFLKTMRRHIGHM